jgi:hypothetical protein
MTTIERSESVSGFGCDHFKQPVRCLLLLAASAAAAATAASAACFPNDSFQFIPICLLHLPFCTRAHLNNMPPPPPPNPLRTSSSPLTAHCHASTMLQGLLADVLDSPAASFIQGLDRRNLNVCIWSGDVALIDLQVLGVGDWGVGFGYVV